MNKGYIVYKIANDAETGNSVFLYVQKTKGLRFIYTQKPGRAKRYPLIRAALISIICRFSFVSYKLVKIYR